MLIVVVISMDVSNPGGLANHAETLADYLYEYGEDKTKRKEYSGLFYTYLLSSCWEKLYSRFSSWQRLGLIRSFEEKVVLLEGHLKLIGSLVGPNVDFMEQGPGSGDMTFTQFLYLNGDAIFGSDAGSGMLVSVLPPDLGLSNSVFDKLREAIYDASKDSKSYLYTKETSLGFHYLVYCAFLLAGHAIREIKDHHVGLNQTGAENKEGYHELVDKFKGRIRAAVLPMKFLHCVLSSTVFKRHIGIWTNDGESIDNILPKWLEKSDNLKFGKKRLLLSKLKLGPSKEVPSEEVLSGTDDDDDDAPEVCKFIYRCKLDFNDASLQMTGILGLPMFYGWVRTFVAHFLAKRNLEVYTAQLASYGVNKRPEIKVFAVNSEKYRMPTWEDFEVVIQNALVDTSVEDTAKIIKIVKEKVTSGKGLGAANRSLHIFRNAIEGGKKKKDHYSLIMHCEAVVAALLDYRRSHNQSMVSSTSTDPESTILAELSKVLGLVPECEFFHSCLPRTWPIIWFRFQNYAALYVGNFSKFSEWDT